MRECVIGILGLVPAFVIAEEMEGAFAFPFLFFAFSFSLSLTFVIALFVGHVGIIDFAVLIGQGIDMVPDQMSLATASVAWIFVKPKITHGAFLGCLADVELFVLFGRSVWADLALRVHALAPVALLGDWADLEAWLLVFAVSFASCVGSRITTEL